MSESTAVTNNASPARRGQSGAPSANSKSPTPVNRWRSIAGAALLIGTIFTFAPLQILLGNTDSASLPSNLYLLAFLLPVIVATVAAAGIDMLLAKVAPRLLPAYRILLTAAALIAWLGWSFSIGFGTLTRGSEVIQEGESATSLLLVIIIVISLLLAILLRKHALILMAVIFIGEVAKIGIAIQNQFNHVEIEDKSEIEWSLSPVSNDIIIVADSLQSALALKAIETSKIEDQLDGFVFYSAAVGVAGNTYLSLPAIHSGTLPSSDYAKWTVEAVENESFLSHNTGIGSNVISYSPVTSCPNRVNCFSRNAFITTSVDGAYLYFKNFTILSMIRLKEWATGRVEDSSTASLARSFSLIQIIMAGHNAMESLISSKIDETSSHTTIMLHTLSTHQPYILNSECEASEILKNKLDGGTQQATCFLSQLQRLISTLKINNVYDVTRIVVLADHGDLFTELLNLNEASADIPFSRLVSRASPTLMIKNRNAHGSLDFDDASISITSLHDFIIDDTNEKPKMISKNNPARFINHHWMVDWKVSDKSEQQRYTIIGSIKNPENWVRTFPKAPQLNAISFSADEPLDTFGFGWYQPESDSHGNDWRWSAGSYSQIYIQPDQLSGKIVKVTAAAVGKLEVDVSVRACGIPVGVFKVRPWSTGLSIFEFHVPEFAGACTSAPLDFSYSTWKRAGGSDPRIISVAFHELAILTQ